MPEPERGRKKIGRCAVLPVDLQCVGRQHSPVFLKHPTMGALTTEAGGKREERTYTNDDENKAAAKES